MGVDSEAQLNRKFIEFAKLLNVYLNHFPKHEKYALANRIRSTAYEVYDLITEGQKRYLKKTTLSNLDITHEQLRMQLHLANELGYFRYKGGRDDEDDSAVISLLGHAKRTQSLRYMLNIIKEIKHAPFLQLPKSYRSI